MGQCSLSSASTDGEIGTNEVLIDVKVSAAMPGGEENTWQVRLERGATIAEIKRHIFELYDVPVQMQDLRREPNGEPLGDEEKLGRESRTTMHLSVRNPLQDLVSALTGGVAPGGGQAQAANPFAALAGGGQAQGANPFAALTEQMSSAMAEMNAIQESLAEAEYSLKFVMPETEAPNAAPNSKPPTNNNTSSRAMNWRSKPAKDTTSSREKEKRCSMKVAATAMVNDVLDMVKLELDVENKSLKLEFAGQALPAAAQIHRCGLSDGDTVMVVPAA